MIRAFARAVVEQHGDLFKADVSLKSQVAGLLRQRLLYRPRRSGRPALPN